MKYEPITPDRLPDLKRLWNETWGEAFPMRESILEQNLGSDPNVDAAGTWVVIDEASDRAVGYVISKIWKDAASGFDFGRDEGYVHTLLVSPDYRGRGIGSELLCRAEAALRDQGAQRVQLGNDFHLRVVPGVPSPDPSVSAWLEKRGYQRQAEVYDLFHDMDENENEIEDMTEEKVHEAKTVEGPLRSDSSQPLQPDEDVTFRLLRQEEAEVLQAFMRRCFPGRWEYQTWDYWRRGGQGREFVVCEKAGAIIGFCRINDADSPVLAQNIYWSGLFGEKELGGIGPLGIDERFRGHGYGLEVVRAGIRCLRERGIRKTVIDTTPYVDFYGKLGYRVWRSYTRYCKTWSEES